MADIRSIDKLILKDHREIATLEAKLKKMGTKDANLEKMIAHLNTEITEKGNEIATLQANLAQANSSLKTINEQFTDSIAAMNIERTANNSMKTEINTVYYAIGTVKELKNQV